MVRAKWLLRAHSTGVGRSGSSCSEPSALGTVGESFSAIVPLQVLESQHKTCEDLTDRLVEAGATVADLEVELKQKDCEIAALKERLKATEQKLQREEARNAWLNEVTGTLTSELQTLCSEALEEHEDQIVVREKLFLKHARYLTVTVGDKEAPLDISRAAVVLCRRNDVLYTSAERLSGKSSWIGLSPVFPIGTAQCHLRAKFYMERIAPPEHAAM
ncbi:hypothetical protein R1flu_023618 [Riccia fluitans]|uniref:Uncharacterized protein n=1 Tax=Riccia fluitans TaxID=41844 RepID=A0ABD1XVI6_9MARC